MKPPPHCSKSVFVCSKVFFVCVSPVQHHRHILPVISNLTYSFHIESFTIITAQAMIVMMTLMIMMLIIMTLIIMTLIIMTLIIMKLIIMKLEILTLMTMLKAMILTLMTMVKTVILTLLYLSWFLTCCATNRTELIAFSRCGSWHNSHCQNHCYHFILETCQCFICGKFPLSKDFRILPSTWMTCQCIEMSSSQNVWHIDSNVVAIDSFIF